jgi:hypothetical protein
MRCRYRADFSKSNPFYVFLELPIGRGPQIERISEHEFWIDGSVLAEK